MKRYLRHAALLLVISQCPEVYAVATSDTHHVEEARFLANQLQLSFESGKPVLPQMLAMRDELRQRIVKIKRMSSLHSPRCKRARHQLSKVNRLIWHLRDEKKARSES